jgi:hypothetical protein
MDKTCHSETPARQELAKDCSPSLPSDNSRDPLERVRRHKDILSLLLFIWADDLQQGKWRMALNGQIRRQTSETAYWVVLA